MGEDPKSRSRREAESAQTLIHPLSQVEPRSDTIVDRPAVPPGPALETDAIDKTPQVELSELAEMAARAGSQATPPPPPRRRATTEPFAIHGVRSPLIGRGPELDQMAEVVSRAEEFLAPQLITVVGNQGTGKTRLVHELLERVSGEATRVYFGEARRGGGRFDAIQSLLRRRFGISDGDTEDKIRANFIREVERAFGDRRVGEVLYFLGEFLNLRFPDSPFVRVLGENPVQHEEIARTVLRRFIEVDAERGPLVLVFDDLQWADDATLKLLQELGASLGGAPVVLIACARPELMLRFSEWGEGSTDRLRIDLRNLGPTDAADMFHNLLTRCDHIPADIVDDAVEMTGGNPHFLEQLVRLFLANGTIQPSGGSWRLDPARAAETELPISVEEAIEARIAALGAYERDVLEKGAVFGNVFWVGAVVALTRVQERSASRSDGEQADRRKPLEFDWTDSQEPVRSRVSAVIEELVRRDYLLQLDPEDSTIVGDVELVFKHNLERELIAKSTDGNRLARYHRLAAQWLETKLESRSEEQLEFLATLYERGGDQMRAAHCYLAGADKAYQRYANEQAVELYERGLSMLEEDDAVAHLRALHNLGAVLDTLGRTEEAEARFTEMLRRAWLFDHQAKAGAAYSRLGRIYRRLGEYDRAMEHLSAAHQLFRRANDRRGVAGTLDDIGRIHWLRGAYDKALEFHRQALSLRRALGDRRSIALSLANIGRVLNDSGDFKAAHRQFREALDLRREIGDLSGVVQSLCDVGGVHAADGTYNLALEKFTEAHNIADEIGERLAQTEVLSRLGECKSAMGRGPEAVEHLMEAISLATSLGNRSGLAACHRRLSEVYLAMGDADQAAERAQRSVKVAEEIGSLVHAGNAHRALAEALAADSSGGPERTAEADREFDRAVQILAGVKNQLDLARVYRSYSGFKERIGDAASAAKLKKRADEIYSRLRGAASGD